MFRPYFRPKTIFVVFTILLFIALGLHTHTSVDATDLRQNDPVRVIPSGLPVITPENADQLVPVAKLGRGSPQNLRWTADGSQLMVIGFSNLWVYSAGNFEHPIHHLELSGEFRRVIDADISNDGSTAIVAEFDKAHLWHVDGDHAPILLTEVREPAVAFHPDGRAVYSTEDFSVHLRDLESDEIVRFEGHTAYVRSLALSADRLLLATASEDGTARVWNAQTGEELQQYELDGSALISVALSPDGNLIAVSGGRGLEESFNPNIVPNHPLAVFDLVSNDRILLATTSLTPNTLNFSADGRSVVVTATSSTAPPYENGQLLPLRATIYNIEDGTALEAPIEEDVRQFRFSPRGDWIAVLTPFGPQILGAADYAVHTTLPYFGWIRFLDFDPDANLMMWQASYATQIVNLDTGVVDADLIGVSGRFFDPSGHVIATTRDNRIQWWNIETESAVREIEIGSDIANLVLSDDGSRLVVHAVGGQISVWDVEARTVIFEGVLDPNVWGYLRYIENEALISYEAYGSVNIWDVVSGEKLLSLSGLGAGAVSPDGRLVGYQVLGETMVNLADTRTGEILATFPILTGSGTGIDFNNDGSWMVVGSSNYLGGDGAFHVIATASLEEIERFDFKGFPSGARFSPDDSLMTLFGESEELTEPIVQLWNLELGELVGTVYPITGASLAQFNANQSLLITGAGTSQASVIDTQTAEQRIVLSGQGSGATGYWFSPDETFIATAAADGTLWLWGVLQ